MSFKGLQIGLSGLITSQVQITTAGKNVSNANTQGYSRQTVITTPSEFNMGVKYVSTRQIRSYLKDNHFRVENSAYAKASVKADGLATLEDYLAEPSGYSINETLVKFFSAVADLSSDPTSLTARSQVVQTALNMTDAINNIYNKYIKYQSEIDDAIVFDVERINYLASKVSDLNRRIKFYEADGKEMANELRDQRNNFLDEISKYVNISVFENPDGTVRVEIGSRALIDDSGVHELQIVKKPNEIDGERDVSKIVWEDGEEVNITSGEIYGYIELRDGGGLLSSGNTAFGIPYFIDKLNTLARAIAININDLHSSGYTIPNEDNGYTSQTGIDFFAAKDGSSYISAKNITVSDVIIRNYYNIAASDTFVNETNKANNNILTKILDLQEGIDVTVDGVNIGNFHTFITQITSELGTVVSEAKTDLQAHESVLMAVENSRLSEMGVSIDEEMVNLIQFQAAYQAAARLITIINENLEILINRMG